MSRENKTNPAQYTQRGRLTPDDAARELARQRSVGSEHTWQPVGKDGQAIKNEDVGQVGQRTRSSAARKGAVGKPSGPSAVR
jgi:hypothetical protein